MMVLLICLTATLVCVALSGFYSGSETGLYCMNRLRLRIEADSGDVRARRLARLVAVEHDALATLLIGTNVANYLATVCVAYLLGRAFGVPAGASEIYTTAIVTPVIFVFGEVVPKTLYQRHADVLMRAGSALCAASALLFRWPVRALNALTRPLLRLIHPGGMNTAVDARSRVALLLRDALAREDVTGDHSEFIDRVLGLSGVAVHQVMAPRNRIISIKTSADRRELLSLVRKHPHSRILTFERSARRILGYVKVHELLNDADWQQVGERVQRVVTLTPHDSVAAAITRLQNAREPMAIVVDRSGYLLGMVTLKDLLEELTGELHDW